MAKKMWLKMKKSSSRYDINRPRRLYGHIYTKYKTCAHVMMVISISQHLSYMKKSSNTDPVDTVIK